jgi:hypothetical protein
MLGCKYIRTVDQQVRWQSCGYFQHKARFDHGQRPCLEIGKGNADQNRQRIAVYILLAHECRQVGARLIQQCFSLDCIQPG